MSNEPVSRYAPREFSGETFDEELDGPRLRTQLERVKWLMLDGHWRGLLTIARTVGGSEAGVSARLRDLRKEQHGGYIVERRRSIDNPVVWQYRVIPKGSE